MPENNQEPNPQSLFPAITSRRSSTRPGLDLSSAPSHHPLPTRPKPYSLEILKETHASGALPTPIHTRTTTNGPRKSIFREWTPPSFETPLEVAVAEEMPEVLATRRGTFVTGKDWGRVAMQGKKNRIQFERLEALGKFEKKVESAERRAKLALKKEFLESIHAPQFKVHQKRKSSLWDPAQIAQEIATEIGIANIIPSPLLPHATANHKPTALPGNGSLFDSNYQIAARKESISSTTSATNPAPPHHQSSESHYHLPKIIPNQHSYSPSRIPPPRRGGIKTANELFRPLGAAALHFFESNYQCEESSPTHTARQRTPQSPKNRYQSQKHSIKRHKLTSTTQNLYKSEFYTRAAMDLYDTRHQQHSTPVARNLYAAAIRATTKETNSVTLALPPVVQRAVTGAKNLRETKRKLDREKNVNLAVEALGLDVESFRAGCVFESVMEFWEFKKRYERLGNMGMRGKRGEKSLESVLNAFKQRKQLHESMATHVTQNINRTLRFSQGHGVSGYGARRNTDVNQLPPWIQNDLVTITPAILAKRQKDGGLGVPGVVDGEVVTVGAPSLYLDSSSNSNKNATGDSAIVGRSSIVERPIDRAANGLHLLGAEINASPRSSISAPKCISSASFGEPKKQEESKETSLKLLTTDIVQGSSAKSHQRVSFSNNPDVKAPRSHPQENELVTYPATATDDPAPQARTQQNPIPEYPSDSDLSSDSDDYDLPLVPRRSLTSTTRRRSLSTNDLEEITRHNQIVISSILQNKRESIAPIDSPASASKPQNLQRASVGSRRESQSPISALVQQSDLRIPKSRNATLIFENFLAVMHKQSLKPTKSIEAAKEEQDPTQGDPATNQQKRTRSFTAGVIVSQATVKLQKPLREKSMALAGTSRIPNAPMKLESPSLVPDLEKRPSVIAESSSNSVENLTDSPASSIITPPTIIVPQKFLENSESNVESLKIPHPITRATCKNHGEGRWSQCPSILAAAADETQIPPNQLRLKSLHGAYIETNKYPRKWEPLTLIHSAERAKSMYPSRIKNATVDAYDSDMQILKGMARNPKLGSRTWEGTLAKSLFEETRSDAEKNDGGNFQIGDTGQDTSMPKYLKVWAGQAEGFR